MSEPLTFEDMTARDDILHFSVATWATSELIDKRNELVQDNECSSICAQFACELGFLALAVVSVIEGLVRAIFGIIIGGPVKCVTAHDKAWSMGAGGGVLSLTNAAICFVALYQNYNQDELDHDEILPCAASFIDAVAGSEVDDDGI